MKRFWWKLLGFKLLAVAKLKKLDQLEQLHNLYDQGYNVFKFHLELDDNSEFYEDGELVKEEIWGKKNIFKPKIVLSKINKYQKYFDTLPIQEILHHTYFAGIVEKDFKIYAYKNTLRFLNNISYDNINIVLDEFKNKTYNSCGIDVYIYSPYIRKFKNLKNWDDIQTISQNNLVFNLILIGRKGFLEKDNYQNLNI